MASLIAAATTIGKRKIIGSQMLYRKSSSRAPFIVPNMAWTSVHGDTPSNHRPTWAKVRSQGKSRVGRIICLNIAKKGNIIQAIDPATISQNKRVWTFRRLAGVSSHTLTVSNATISMPSSAIGS